MKAMRKNGCGTLCELAQKSVDQSLEVSTPCFDDHQWTKDAFEIVGELTDVCASN